MQRPIPYPDQETTEAIAELEAYAEDLDDDARAIARALLARLDLDDDAGDALHLTHLLN